MSAVDSAVASITFDGTTIGGLEGFEFVDGEPREITFRPTRAPAGIALPGQPDHGRCRLRLIRDRADPGQIKLQSSLRNREVRTCVVTYKTGQTETFSAFCLKLPTAGSKGSTTPVQFSNCLLRISGAIT